MQELTLNLPEGIDDGSFMGRTAVRGIIRQNGKYLVILGKQGDCKFPGGGMEQGEFLFGTLTREVLEETGCHVKPDSIREGFLVHEKTNRQSEEVLVMDSYYYFCEVEDIRDSKEAADASGYVVGNFHEGEAGTVGGPSPRFSRGASCPACGSAPMPNWGVAPSGTSAAMSSPMVRLTGSISTGGETGRAASCSHRAVT